MVAVHLNLRQVVFALADALDLVGIASLEHGKRVAYLADSCGKLLGFTQPLLDTLFNAALLHDCGVSSASAHNHILSKMEWPGAQTHCLAGATLLQSFAPLQPLSEIILHHHTRWEHLPAETLSPHTRLMSNLIFLVDRVDALTIFYQHQNVLVSKTAIRKVISGLDSRLFAPRLIEVFMAASAQDAFWLGLEQRHLWRYLTKLERTQQNLSLNMAELRQLGMIFASIVDTKSAYTLEHSQGVARLARLLAEKQGLSAAVCEKIEVAGLLHDLGKLKVPDAILEKPGPLTLEERAIIHHHSFETYQILQRIEGLEDIAIWAGSHHESPNGSGYPFGLREAEVGLEARIIGVADVFQALAQKRPYRAPLTPQQILETLAALAEEGRLDGAVVKLVGQNLEHCWQVATSSQPCAVLA